MTCLRIAYRNVDLLPDAANRARIQRRAEAVDAIFVTTGAPIAEPPEAPETRGRYDGAERVEVDRSHSPLYQKSFDLKKDEEAVA